MTDGSDVPTRHEVSVDRTLCAGMGVCASLVPETFSIDPYGVLQVGDSAGASREGLERAVEACPMSALEINDR